MYDCQSYLKTSMKNNISKSKNIIKLSAIGSKQDASNTF